MSETQKGFIQLHLSVLLAGFTGLFGRLITLNEVDIVWYRMLFTSCILLVFTGLPKTPGGSGGRRRVADTRAPSTEAAHRRVSHNSPRHSAHSDGTASGRHRQLDVARKP